MSQVVGFQLQGDVFLGGALGFSTIGRVLKQMSNAGMDIYAVHALIQLGGLIPISQQQENVVSAAMRKRSQSRQGWLIKALTVGWGHTDPVYEISKLRGGCAALLTLNAFVAGTNALAAAQGLQELMRLNGCEAGNLPAIDPLQHVISALSPIMEDSGFHSVLQTIRLASVVELGRLLPGVDFLEEQGSLMQDTGRPRDWADAAHQLLLTASMKEHIYVHARSRAAWLAAFAVNILEMDCTLVHHSHELWRAAGRNGRVTIQIAFEAPAPSNEGSSRKFKLDPEARIGQIIRDLESTYLLKDALESELQLIPNLSYECRREIKCAIVRLFTFLSTRPCFTDQHWSKTKEAVKITGSFPAVEGNIVAVCKQMGIDLHDLDREVASTLRSAHNGFLLPIKQGSEWELLSKENQTEIESICYCDYHAQEETHWGYTCHTATISHIISGFATAALALLPCHLDHPLIRVVADSINGRSSSKWSTAAMKTLTDPAARVNLPMLLDHLRLLFFAKDIQELSKYAVAVSARAITVAVRTLLDEDAFNDSGQYLGIYSGRLAYGDCFRNIVEESERWAGGGQDDQLIWPAMVAQGVHFVPVNAKFLNRLEIDCKIEVMSKHFEVHCDLVPTSAELTRRTNDTLDEEGRRQPRILFTCTIHDSIYNLLTAKVGSSCGHAVNSAFVVPHSDPIFAAIETGVYCVRPSDDSCAFISAHGSRSSILFSLCAVQGAVTSYVDSVTSCCLILQGNLCLRCAYRLATQQYQMHGQYRSAAIFCTGVSSNETVSEGVSPPIRPFISPTVAGNTGPVLARFPLDASAAASLAAEAARGQRSRSSRPRPEPRYQSKGTF